MFMYPPAFGFAPLTNLDAKVKYRYDVLAADGRLYRFRAATPNEPLTNLWAKLPTGFTSVTCAAETDGEYRAGTVVGSRVFWKSAPFRGDYHNIALGVRMFGKAAERGLSYVLDAPSSKYLLEHGELDPNFSHNVYPSKMLESVIGACCSLAKCAPARKPEALRLARAAADWLIAHGEKPDAPLAYFPPTYRGELYAAKKNAGQVMTVYPARVALAFLDLAEAGGGEKYADAAERIAKTYLRLQGADGTWPLKMRVADGTATSPNRLVPIDSVLPLMDRLAARTGRGEYRVSAERAFANIRDTRLKTWNWEGQFEDVEPGPKFTNLTKYGPCDTAIWLVEHSANDPAQIAIARELLRFSEDQFVCWERPFVGADFKVRPSLQDMNRWTFPCALEQYNWYTPIDASAAKLVLTYLALYKAEGRPLDLAKAQQLGAAIIRQQEPEGWIHTHWAWEETPDKIWMNCHVAAAQALLALAAFD